MERHNRPKPGPHSRRGRGRRRPSLSRKPKKPIRKPRAPLTGDFHQSENTEALNSSNQAWFAEQAAMAAQTGYTMHFRLLIPKAGETLESPNLHALSRLKDALLAGVHGSGSPETKKLLVERMKVHDLPWYKRLWHLATSGQLHMPALETAAEIGAWWFTTYLCGASFLSLLPLPLVYYGKIVGKAIYFNDPVHGHFSGRPVLTKADALALKTLEAHQRALLAKIGLRYSFGRQKFEILRVNVPHDLGYAAAVENLRVLSEIDHLVKPVRIDAKVRKE